MASCPFPSQVEQISSSMVRNVFTELKANGYSDGQIAALSRGLMDMAKTAAIQDGRAGSCGWWGQDGPGLLGFPEEFESLYLAGLM